MTNENQIIHLQDSTAWDSYVQSNASANPYQYFDWQTVINQAYSHRTYALAAIKRTKVSGLDTNRLPPNFRFGKQNPIIGILPLVHLESRIFGSRLVSMPFLDHGGLLANNNQAEVDLIASAIKLGRKLKARSIELRHLSELACIGRLTHAEHPQGTHGGALPSEISSGKGNSVQPSWTLRNHKVRMLMSLPDASETLMKSFKSKLRSQIQRPLKSSLAARIGGLELLDDFYQVFAVNMHELGSPVHAKRFPLLVMQQFAQSGKIVVVYQAATPVAASIMVGFNTVMTNPWSSALRSHSQLSPNMLLYWTMLAYASDSGYRYFDFGRSTPGEGTYRFKTQWGAQPQAMYWYTIWLQGSLQPALIKDDPQQGRLRAIAVYLWRRMPVSVSRIIGPLIRKHIDL